MIDVAADVTVLKVDGAAPTVGKIPTCRFLSVNALKLELVILVPSTGNDGPKYEMKIDEVQRALDTVKAAHA